MSSDQTLFLSRRRYLAAALGSAAAAMWGIPALASAAARPDLTETLIRRGYGDANIQAVLGGNFRRLLDESWQPQTTQVEKKS